MNEKELTHISLFSGIGGFDIAGEWAGFRTVVFCEKEEFCQKVLKKHWPEIPIIPEIRDFDGTEWQGATLLTAGVPCQPASTAGKRKGKIDDRWLWPEALRITEGAKPRWCIFENPTGILALERGLVFEELLVELEGQGYKVQPVIIPACSVNAPHRRDRVWIVANNESGRFKRRSISIRQRKSQEATCIIDGENSHASDSQRERLEGTEPERNSCPDGRTSKCLNDASDSTSQGLSRIQESQFKQSVFHAQRGDWQKDWYEVATRFCRVDDGIPAWVHRLKALGNAIVPQVAYEILRHIAWIEKAQS